MQDIELDDLSNITGGAGVRSAISVIKSAQPVRNFDDGYKLGQASATLQKAVGQNEAALNKPRRWLSGSSVNGRIDQLLGPPR